VGEWPRNVRHGRVHGGVRGREVREGEVVDRWGPRTCKSGLTNGRSALKGRTHQVARENGHEHEGTSADNPAPPGSGKERARAWTRTLADRWDPPVRRSGREHGLAGWAGLAGLKCVLLFL
jgi:hypothetical protein